MIREIDYVELYAKKLLEDDRISAQQKMLLDSQIRASREFFRNAFAGKDFKTEARKYLKARGLI